MKIENIETLGIDVDEISMILAEKIDSCVDFDGYHESDIFIVSNDISYRVLVVFEYAIDIKDEDLKSTCGILMPKVFLAKRHFVNGKPGCVILETNEVVERALLNYSRAS